jgi:hypothetical protein
VTNYDHLRYPAELGFPEWLGHVEDELFEGMSVEKSRTWPFDFLSAIKPGADLERIKGPFLVMVLTSALETINSAEFPQIKDAIDGVITVWMRDDIGSPEFSEAMANAAIAAEAVARAVPWNVNEAAWAAQAAASAWSDLSEVEAAVRLATAWDGEAVREAKYGHFGDELLKLLADAPMSA